ncbi:hypothetical protein PAP18089_03067 [Pandoraea apista]|uniref:Replication origin-binding protein domain-containing protein n=1 Tax=Pandoraea apista TaxID=93218 RepID=A0A5E5P780_9BURK|nr:plasmid replication protein, CyRepA1 family [Pandoraea apista]VVG72075.1 hypothetical protein PAP18089_03067 [Pandoraea apista]
MHISVNTQVINKNKTGIAQAWNTVDFSIDDLVNHVREGHAFSYVYRDSKRHSDNFERADYLMVDIDHKEGKPSLQIDDARDSAFVKQYGGVIYTTCSHTDDKHHFRIVFELEEPILDPLALMEASNGLIQKFQADEACKDAARISFGNSNAKVWVLGNKLPATVVTELRIEGREWVQSRNKDVIRATSRGRSDNMTVHSSLTLSPDMEIQLPNGTWTALKFAPKGAATHCPKHIPDRNASAVVVKNRYGINGIHCSTCSRTYWTDRGQIGFKENAFDEVVEQCDINRVVPRFAEVFGEDEFSKHATTDFIEKHVDQFSVRTNSRFLPSPKISLPGTTIIKSPKGSGKTEYLKQVIQNARENNQSVLIVGHRVALLKSMADRLGVTCYVQEERLEYDEDGSPTDRVERTYVSPASYYAVCLDSLQRRIDTQERRYDVVIIDEVEQVLSHLVSSSTLGVRREGVYNTLRYFLRNASYRYLLDADAHLPTLRFSELVGTVHEQQTTTLVVNEYVAEEREVRLYKSEKHLISELFEAISAGKRVYFCSNSRTDALDISEIIAQKFGETRRVMTITSQNSAKANVREFLNNISSEFLQYDVLIGSPSIGTGIDISFPDDAQEVDAVFGLFSASITTHFDIDQQLGRVRNPGEMHVWISPEVFNFESDPEIIKHDLVRYDDEMKRHAVIDDRTGAVTPSPDAEFLELSANVIGRERFSMNRLRKNWIEYRQNQGWRVIDVERDDLSSKAGSALVRDARDGRVKRETHAIMIAERIDDSAAAFLMRRRERTSLADAEQASLERYFIEDFFKEEVSEQLVSAFDGGRIRNRLSRFESLLTHASGKPTYGSEESHRQNRDRMLGAELLVALFDTAGVRDAQSGLFHVNKEYTAAGLRKFANICLAHKNDIENLLDVQVRGDVVAKPTQQLGDLLKLVGVEHRCVRRARRKDGGKDYFYQLTSDSIAFMQGIYARRRKAEEDDLMKILFPTPGTAMARIMTILGEKTAALHPANDEHRDGDATSSVK